MIIFFFCAIIMLGENMKNKGFTLVELLAVIAILAILVIVAMPNVLGMFNEAKVNVFVTDVQRYMDAATTSFTKDALNNAGKTIYYSSVDNATLKTKKLDMSGAEKEYFIEIDRNGNFKRIVVYDDNYCYDIYTTSSYGNETSTNSKYFIDKIEKTPVAIEDVWESGNDDIVATISGTSYVVSGCEGVITVDGRDDNQPSMVLNSVEYSFVPGMTWEEWVGSELNSSKFPLIIDNFRPNYVSIKEYGGGYLYLKSPLTIIPKTDEIISGAEYVTYVLFPGEDDGNI